MINKVLILAVYILRWLGWLFHNLIILPAATLVFIGALLFCLDNTTPGAVAVDYLQKAVSITDGQRWTWHECTKQTPAELSPSSVYQQEVCPEVVSDAQGYAAYIDRSLLDPLFGVWVLMGLTYGGLAWLQGYKPYYSRYVFVEVAGGAGYIRRAFTRPERGMGNPAIFPVKKGAGKHRGSDIYVSSLSSQAYNENDKCAENEGEK